MAKTNFIEIPGYKVLVPNNVWYRETDIEMPLGGIKIPAVQLIKLEKYDIFTNEQILDFIKTSARKKLSYRTKGIKEPEETGSSFLRSLEGLKPRELERIARSEPKIIAEISGNIPDTGHIPGTYLDFRNGFLPMCILRNSANIPDSDKGIFYELKLDNHGLKTWKIALMLDGKDSIPEKKKIEVLLESCVTNSKVLTILGEIKYDEAIKQIQFLYSSLNPRIIRTLSDISRHILINRASYSLKQREENQKKQLYNPLEEIAKGIAGIIGIEIETISPNKNEQEEQKAEDVPNKKQNPFSDLDF